MTDFQRGEHVMASTDGKHELLCHLLSVPKKQADGTDKAQIQLPDGGKVLSAYREPGQRDEAGSGGTFWKV